MEETETIEVKTGTKTDAKAEVVTGEVVNAKQIHDTEQINNIEQTQNVQTQNVKSVKNINSTHFEIYDGIDLNQIKEKISEHTKRGIIELITIGGYLDKAKQLCLDNNIKYKDWLADSTNYTIMQGERLIKAFNAVKKYPLILEQPKNSINQVLLDYKYYENPNKIIEDKKKKRKPSYTELRQELEMVKKKFLERELKYRTPGEHVQDLTLKLVEKESEIRSMKAEIETLSNQMKTYLPEDIESLKKKYKEIGKKEGISGTLNKILDWIRYKKVNNIKFTIKELLEFVNKIESN